MSSRITRSQTLNQRGQLQIESSWDRFYGNITFNLETRIEGLAEYGRDDKKDTMIRQAYQKYMAKSGNFGTFSELTAAAEFYGFIVHIFQRDEHNNFICYESGSTDNPIIDRKKPKLFLLFTGPTDAGHFRPLEPSIAPTVIIPGKYQASDSLPTSNQQVSKITIRKCQESTADKANPNLSETSPQSFSCDVCKRSFETKRSLASHRNAHFKNNASEETTANQSEPSKSTPPVFSCDVCKQSFDTKRGLKVHRSRHAKEANDTTASRIKERLITAPTVKTSPTHQNDVSTSRSALYSDDKFRKSFECFENSEVLNEAEFDENVEKFQKFLFTVRQRLPGPQHPSTKFYRLRQQKKNRKETSAQQSRSSNPQRTDARAKQRRRDTFQYDLAQYWYYNQRKKAVRLVMTKGSSKQCRIKMDVMEKHINSVFENPNNRTLDSYPTSEIYQNVVLSEEDIRIQIKRMPLDTSAGPDRVLVKTLRQLSVAKSISSIANTMLRTSYVPKGFRNGNMIFIDKEGDVNCVNNWRPLIIFSVIRRVIEKALDAVVRSQVRINGNQRGFVSGIPGCHVNARLVNACLKNAKKFKRNCVVVFIDISKAFDKIGHLHISKSLESKGVSKNVRDLIMSLLSNNSVAISMGRETSNPIPINCGVPQGGPLSPILFNIAADFIYEEICDPQYTSKNGYKLDDNYDHLCLSGFADDNAVTAHSENAAIRTIELIQILYLKIGLQMNPDKSQLINIKNGALVEDSLQLSNGSEIASIKPDQRIKYLGCSFNSELVFDDTCIGTLNSNLDKLTTSPLLKPDQKLNVINQYVFPTLVYPLQAAPIIKIPKYVTDGLDIMIRRSVKAIIGLPQRTNDFMFYSPRKLRGLGLFRASWEVFLQHFSLASKLSRIDDGLFQAVSDCSSEMEACIEALAVTGDNTKILRTALRKNAFENWCNLKYQGSGAIHFETHTASNDFVYNKNSLSSSEWVAAIKLNTNYANPNGVPGVSSTSNLCRRCNREIETIPHVTGSCSHNNSLIVARHHSVKHFIMELLKLLGYACYEEVYAVDIEGRSRFSDIIAFAPNTQEAHIIDPTIRYETNDQGQDKVIQEEKAAIYEKCIPFYSEKYSSSFGTRKWIVHGLFFGARGCYGQSVIDFFNDFKLDKTKLKELSELILMKTIHIINQHIYN